MSGHAVGNELTIQTLTWDQRDRYIYLERVTAYRENTKRYEDILIQEIAALQELKGRIVADVVTGAIDVRDISIPEYEFISDVDNIDSDEETETEDIIDEQEE